MEDIKMANPYLNVYMGNPTEGGTDGTVISTDGSQTAPLVVNLDAAQNETKKVKLALRCESGYTTQSDTVIQDVNDTNDYWKFSLTENGTYADSITISSAISNVNTIFWAQASSSSLESPTRDTGVSLRVTTIIQATT